MMANIFNVRNAGTVKKVLAILWKQLRLSHSLWEVCVCYTHFGYCQDVLQITCACPMIQKECKYMCQVCAKG